MKYHCCTQKRRNAVAAHATLNGIDYLEVIDRDLPPLHAQRQRTLLLRFLKPIAGLNADNVQIEGGDRIRDVAVEWAARALPVPAALTPEEAALVAALPEPDRVLVIRCDSSGDKSTYTLRLVRTPLDAGTPAGFDPQLAEVTFSFKVECPSDFDCKPQQDCLPAAASPVEINYLAKDYASFRRLLLDRISQLMPDQRNRPAADLGVTLAELLAYVGDHLSYRQDAAATEAYLGTARQRVSVRRHALLVDYAMHDGCNARSWIHVNVDAPAVPLAKSATRFLTRCRGLPTRIKPASAEEARALSLHPEVFQPLHDVVLRSAHNELPLYTWGDERCCLPAGATAATLRGSFPLLAAGDALLLEEIAGPVTGLAEDADPRHRHVVRLVEVVHSDGGAALTDPLDNTPITRIRWHEDDALPFALCISATSDAAHGGIYNPKVSVARGNLLLADHGLSISAEALGKVPAPALFYAGEQSGAHCDAAAPVALRPRFRPVLARLPLTQASGYDAALPASAQLRQTPAAAQPCIKLYGKPVAEPVREWAPQRNLLDSRDDEHFVAEIDADGRAALRFGDERNGRFPREGTAFSADYRVGNGAAGNVGAESIVHVISAQDGIVALRNPLPAQGGVDPESLESVRRSAPEAWRRQERAVTPEDYAEVSQRHAQVDRAAATLRWTGSWHTVFVNIDRRGGGRLTPALRGALHGHLERYRMAGHDVALAEPVYVPLELDLHICVAPDHFRSDVRRSLTELFSSRQLRDGRRGLFHPDNFSFAQSVYLSALYAAAHAVPGVQSAQVTTFRRQGSADTLALQQGRLSLGRLEIARLDNDPNYPERGVLRLELHGGK